MSLYLKQDDTRTELQKRVAAELQAKARKPEPVDLPDGVDDSQFVKGTKATTSLAWVWVVIVIAAVVALIWLAATAMNQNA
jgi:hypothetical protein